ncbi:MAG: hypothetical protein Q8O92_08030 [Candidatus Latescibacter sp.]|nr:hypothetical protein [Candidatus Latescibacter sp.]
MQSTWCDRRIAIDGVDNGDEWANARKSFDEQKITVGMYNNDETVFILLSTSDQRIQRQLLAFGLTLWLDEYGGSAKVLGLRFPLGMKNPGGSSGGGLNTRRGNQMDAALESIQDNLELIGPELYTRSIISVNEAQKYGIQCRIGSAQGKLVYELQYPLQRTDSCPYGISEKKVMKVGIGIETGRIDFSQERQQLKERSGGGRSSSGSRGGTGGSSGSGSSRKGGGSGSSGGSRGSGGMVVDPFEMGVKAKLAERGADKP